MVCSNSISEELDYIVLVEVASLDLKCINGAGCHSAWYAKWYTVRCVEVGWADLERCVWGQSHMYVIDADIDNELSSFVDCDLSGHCPIIVVSGNACDIRS